MSGASRSAILLGLIGEGIQASRTPSMHEQEATEHGLRCIYRLIDLERLELPRSALPDLLSAAERMGFDGLNITHPCKQAVIPLLHELSPEAAAIGAVNTVVLSDRRRVGHNTDCLGFAEGFRRGLPDADLSQVVQIGAGGAGAAVAHALLSLGAARLAIVDVDPDRAGNLARNLAGRFGPDRAMAPPDLAAAMTAATGLVNATPVGMARHPGLPLPASLLRRSLWVSEIIYFPIETELLRRARAIGCRTLDGGGMAVSQAALAFELFTGMKADAGRMRRHFDQLGKTAGNA
ncbi:MAG: shikimate dehydrogenase [Acetobacteraceae bacterium]